jgi:hypothetical protein
VNFLKHEINLFVLYFQDSYTLNWDWLGTITNRSLGLHDVLDLNLCSIKHSRDFSAG